MTDSVESKGDIVDIEEYVKAGKKIPKADQYKIKIDGDKYIVEVTEMTSREILVLAGKHPVEMFALYQKPKGGKPTKLGLDEVIDFTERGVERFTTLPLDQQEGEAQRRDFPLLEEDEEFLDSLGLRWEAIAVGEDRRVVVYENSIPGGYNATTADVHFRITTTYPDTEIDMAYFYPALARGDGRGIKAVSSQTFNGQQWQQWSRHRKAPNVWRPGIDNLSTHYPLAFEWLTLELKKG